MNRLNRSARILPAALLPLLLVTGCEVDPTKPKAELTLETTPAAIEVLMGEEDASPVQLTITTNSSEDEVDQVALTYFSSDATVATVAGLSGEGLSEEKVKNDVTLTCGPKQQCFFVSPKQVAQLTVSCHKAGSATIQIQGDLTVTTTSDAPLRSTDTASADTSFDVTCIVKTSACDDPRTESLLDLGDELIGDGAALCAAIDLDLDDAPTVHSSDEIEPMPGQGDWTELYGHMAMTTALSEDEVTNPLLECGQHDRGETFCLGFDAPMQAGEYSLIASVLHASPPASPSQHLTYGFVMDSDGDQANNFEAHPAYPNDFYQGTDLWAQLHHDPSIGWFAESSLINDGVPTAITGTQARLLLIDNIIMLMIPQSELFVPRPRHRITAFGHAGDYGLGGGLWSGDLHPIVAAGLLGFE